MSYAQLRAFHAVAAQGSFSRAAAALGLTQPTLSGQVKTLEASYRVRLFDRRGRTAELTELGRALFEITGRLFAAESDTRQLLSTARGLVKGQLKAGADSPYYIIPVLASFCRLYPTVERAISFGNSQQVLSDLYRRRIDVAILPKIPQDERIYSVPFRRDRLVVITDRSHPWCQRRSVRLRDLAGQAFVLREQGSTTRAVLDAAAAKVGLVLKAALELGSREAVREAVAAGLGITVIAEEEIGNDDRLHRLAIGDATLEVTEFAACLKACRSEPVVRAFIELVEEMAQT